MTSSIRLNPSAINGWSSSRDAQKILDRVGEAIAADARASAPRDTGEGAESITHEVGVDEDGAFVRVSWDRDHYYMLFPEVGTSDQPARPFLRPAATKRRNL